MADRKTALAHTLDSRSGIPKVRRVSRWCGNALVPGQGQFARWTLAVPRRSSLDFASLTAHSTWIAWPRQPQPAHTTPSVSNHTHHVDPGPTPGLTYGLVSTRSTAASIVASSSCRQSRHFALCEGNSFFWHAREQNHVTPHAHTLEAAWKHVAHFLIGGAGNTKGLLHHRLKWRTAVNGRESGARMSAQA